MTRTNRLIVSSSYTCRCYIEKKEPDSQSIPLVIISASLMSRNFPYSLITFHIEVVIGPSVVWSSYDVLLKIYFLFPPTIHHIPKFLTNMLILFIQLLMHLTWGIKSNRTCKYMLLASVKSLKEERIENLLSFTRPHTREIDVS